MGVTVWARAGESPHDPRAAREGPPRSSGTWNSPRGRGASSAPAPSRGQYVMSHSARLAWGAPMAGPARPSRAFLRAAAARPFSTPSHIFSLLCLKPSKAFLVAPKESQSPLGPSVPGPATHMAPSPPVSPRLGSSRTGSLCHSSNSTLGPLLSSSPWNILPQTVIFSLGRTSLATPPPGPSRHVIFVGSAGHPPT